MYLSKLDATLDKKLGADWHNWEIETVSLELGAQFDDISVVNLVVLKALQENPDIILNDADYFMRFVEIANGNVPDPHHADIPTSLELDFALSEMEKILGGNMQKTSMLRNVITYVVNNEGHGKIASPRLAKYSGKSMTQTEFTKAYEMYATDMRK